MNYKNLFLRQSYLDAYDEYEKSLRKADYPLWDYVIITASNDRQAAAYTAQIDYRLRGGKLPEKTHYAVLADPEGKRVGSGGATLNALRYIRNIAGGTFADKKILVIHSGGDSKRIPQYSVCGKLFSRVPHLLPDGRCSTLFDEILAGLTGVPARLKGGMLVASGDVLLLFNPLQIDFYEDGAAAFSVKEGAETGKDHGVYLRDRQGNVGQFLHKQTVETLREQGAVDLQGRVDIDTGAVFFGSRILDELYALIQTEDGFARYVNPRVRLSFYADFLYPLASGSTLEQFYREKPEGDFSEELRECRKSLWAALHKYQMKLLCFAPGAFVHFGTTGELLALLTERLEDYSFLDWSRHVNTNSAEPGYAAVNSYIQPDARIQPGSYIEDSYIQENVSIGRGCVVSGVTLRNTSIPDGTVIHGLKLLDGKFVVRMYGVADNPAEAKWFGKPIDMPLWNKKLFLPCDTMEEAVAATLAGTRGDACLSLRESFALGDAIQILSWQENLDEKIKQERYLAAVHSRAYLPDANEILKNSLTPKLKRVLEETAATAAFGDRMRIYYYLSRLMDGDAREQLESKCFQSVRDAICQNAAKGIRFDPSLRIAREEVVTRLPVRVNWGGGWSDTPPHCNEQGGTVLNAAFTLRGRNPVESTVRRLDTSSIILASTDVGARREFTDVEQLWTCSDPHDPFALHKAALITCGVIPRPGESAITMKALCSRLGGGLYLNTCVTNVPKGSGLGTSSIIAGACLKGLFAFFGVAISENDLFNRVLCMEQLMSTGGGWQDQVGGLVPGVKMITTEPGLEQHIHCEPVALSPDTLRELKDRFCLVYTGQRRLARNLLREIVGKYIASEPATLFVLRDIQRLAHGMRQKLQEGDIDGFAALLDEHWELNKKLDAGCTNTCIDQIFVSIDDLIDGRMICGAGGGGFVQVVLKKGKTADDLRRRLCEVFADSGVEVWECEIA